MGILRQFPDQPSNINWNRFGTFLCILGCEHWRLLNRKAAWYSYLFMGTITWVDSLARYGAEAFICHHLNWQKLWNTACSYSCWTICHPHPCTGGGNRLCNYKRKQHHEPSVFWLRQVLMRGFQSTWMMIHCSSGKLDCSKGLSMQKLTFNQHFGWGTLAFNAGCALLLLGAQLCALGLGLTSLTRHVFREAGHLEGTCQCAAGLINCRDTPWTLVSERHNPRLPRRL